MKPELYRAKLTVKPSSIHGYGVFAEQDFAPDELIEECYALLFTKKDQNLINYYYCTDKGSALCFGLGSIYNHSDIPNAEYIYSYEHDVMEFRALKQIKKGEEIFTSYGEQWFSSRNTKARKPSFFYRFREQLSSLRLVIRFTLVVISILVLLSAMQWGLQMGLRFA